MASPLQATLNALFLGLEELAPLPADATCVAMLRAMHTVELQDYTHAREWVYEQSFAPYADALRQAGYPVSPERIDAPETMDRVLVVATRFAEENLALLARGWRLLKPGGVLLAAQHNDLGAKRLDSTMKRLTGERESISKHHCRAIAVTKPMTLNETAEARAEEWLQEEALRPVPDTPLLAAPGMFSWRKVDAGSQLLVDALPKQLVGRGGDVAAGWGYLSWAVLQKCPQVSHITLYEAEKHALDAAELNLNHAGDRCRYVWCDATRPLDTGGQPLDWVVMNPPAHDLLWSAPEASAAMFARVAEALRAGGTLWLVANRHLPYERTLDAHFRDHATIQETGDFKVIEAVK